MIEQQSRYREKYIKKGRALVGVNMGEGFEKYNDPAKVIYFLELNCGRAESSLYCAVTWFGGGNHFYPRYFDNQRVDGVEDALEKFQTARLELAFLYGRQNVIDSIIKRGTNV